MCPARKPWTPSINAAGLGMLPMGSVGSITITTVEVVATATAGETSNDTPRSGAMPGPTASDHPTLIRVAVILLSGQGVVKDRGIGPRPLGAQASPIWRKCSLGAHRSA